MFAVELKPDLAWAYSNRASAYYYKGDSDSAWADVRRCRERGGQPNPELIRLLREAAGRSEQSRPPVGVRLATGRFPVFHRSVVRRIGFKDRGGRLVERVGRIGPVRPWRESTLGGAA